MTAAIESAPSRAATPPAGSAGAACGQYLTFQLGGEMFAIGILAIKEIIEYRAPTAVPLMPATVRGVINLRGAVVPVLDLQACFGRAPREVGKRTCLVIVEVRSDDGRQTIGVVVDAVSEVIDIAASEIEPPPAFGAHIRSDFIQGMGKVGGRFVILLDVDRAASVQEIAALAGAAEAPLALAA